MNIENIKTIVLVGGKGERLKPYTNNIPKAMIKIGNRPLLYHIITNSKKQGFTQFIFKTGHLSKKIENYFGDGKNFGCDIKYSIETKLLGTCGGLKYLEKEKYPIIVIYGDLLLNFNFRKLIDYHTKKKSIATLVSHKSTHPEDSDVIVNQRGKVKKIIHKPGSKVFGDLTSAAIYVLNPECFSFIPENIEYDFTKNLFPNLLDKNINIYTYESKEYIKDVGTINRFENAKKELKEGKVFSDIEAIFLDRDGTINEEVDLLKDINDLKIINSAIRGIKKINNLNIPIFVVTNQPVIARGLCTEQDVKKINLELINLLDKKGAYVTKIYYCPHHPDKGYPEENKLYKMQCNCRKPKIGLLIKAKNEFDINLSKCFMIGDTTTDILTGKNASCKTILVKTGYFGKDKKYTITPDFTADNLFDAANIVVKYDKTKNL